MRVLDCSGSGTLSQVANGLDWIYSTGQVGVVSMSLGTTYYSSVLDAAVQQLISAGFPVVAAAGNDGASACSDYPGGFANVLSVAATDSTDALAWFSNFGSCVDVAAPGVDVLSGWPGGGTKTLSGTSMATPLVSGAIAALLSSAPSTTPAQAAAWIASQATAGALQQPLPAGTPDRLLYLPATIGSGATPSPTAARPPPPPPTTRPPVQPSQGSPSSIAEPALPLAALLFLLASGVVG